MVRGRILMEFKVKKISSDASLREFYRVQKNKKSSIIVVAKKNKKKNLFIYCAVNEILNKNKILAPKLINNFSHKNIIEISDLGKTSFLDFIKKKKNKTKEYKKLIDLINKMQNIKFKKIYNFKNKKIKFETYTIKNLHKESDLFFDWYLKSLKNIKKFSLIKLKIKKELNIIYKKLYFKNKYFTHRDFHVSNIMVSKKKLGLIDSQDAILGNPLYDVASLIDDVRIKIPKKIQIELFDYYFAKSKLEKKNKLNFKNDFDILSVQRNLKILGIFVRLFKRDKKPNYLKYLPYTWTLIERRMKNPVFYNLSTLMKKYLQLKKIKKIKIA